MKIRFGCALVLGSCLSLFSACKGDDGGVSADNLQEVQPGRCNTAPKSDTDPASLTPAPGCEALITSFPTIEAEDSPEDKKVLCPFVRILNKSRQFADEIVANLESYAFPDAVLPVSVGSFTKAAEQLGCGVDSCGGAIVVASGGQSGKPVTSVSQTDIVDIGKLHTAKGLAHNCGFNFALGDTEVNETARDETLAKMKGRAVDGRLTHADILQTKKDMCLRDFELAKSSGLPTINPVSAAGDTLDPGVPDTTEVNLIYSYLGGIENGFVLYSDVELFFHGQMPVNKTKYVINGALFKHLSQVLAGGQQPSP